MTVQLITTINRYAGLSSDAKPIVDVKDGSEFYEADTEITYVFDAISTSWKSKRSSAMEAFEGRMDVNDNLEQIQGLLRTVIEVLQEKL